MTLTKSATLAFEKQRRIFREQEVQTARSVATDFEKRFGTYVALTDFDLDHARFTLEGMTFRYERARSAWLYSLLWFCPNCGAVARSEYVHDLAGLGKWLAAPIKTGWKERCGLCSVQEGCG